MPPQDDSPYPRHELQRRSSPAWWPALALLVVAGLGAWWWSGRQVAPPVAAPPSPAAKARAPVPEPAIRYPLETAKAEAAAPLPALDESDAAFWDAVAALLGKKGLGEILRPEKLVRSIVATVDNLPRASVSARINPVNPTPGALAVQGKGGEASIAPGNAARYASRLRFLQSADAKRLVDLYLAWYPLFQKAYEELGYPGHYFNDRLIEAIDDALAAPESTAPVRLHQPKVLYHYADQALEARSAGQKIMMRIGAGNQGLAKAKLREIRREILGRAPAPK